MKAAFEILFAFFKPLLVVMVSIFSIVATIAGAIANPAGFVNQTLCGAIDMISGIFPSTPENLKIASIINGLGDAFPAVGRGIIREVFVSLGVIFGINLAIKIYKLIPFKAT